MIKEEENTNTKKTTVVKRGKGKIQSPLTLSDSHKYYLSEIPESSKYYIEWSLYKYIIAEFNKRMMDAIIKDGYFFKMPYRLGTIRIKKRKTNLNVLRPDFKVYHQTGGKVIASHLNDHTDGYYVRFYWNKIDGVIVKNKTLYSFIPTRANSRALSALLKNKEIQQIHKYFE